MNLTNLNLLSNIATYLPIKSIIFLSHCNKKLYNDFAPNMNNVINNIFLQNVMKVYFGQDSKTDLPINENLLYKFGKSKINWKHVFISITQHYKNYRNKEISKKILECFCNHLYLPDLRKSNKYLEKEFSTNHMIFCYDSLFRNNLIFNYHIKQVNYDLIFKGINSNNPKPVKVLKEGLFFQKELEEFSLTFKQIKENENCVNCFKNLIEYDYESLESNYNKYFAHYNNNGENNNSISIMIIILWINHCFILYSDLIYEYIKNSTEENEHKEFVNEFNQKYNDLINCALLVNSNLENVNTIINCFLEFYSFGSEENSDKPKMKDRFCFYKLFYTIIKRNVFVRLYDRLCLSISSLMKTYSTELFENLDKPKSYEKQIEEDELYMDEASTMDIDEFFDENVTIKETLGNIFNCFVDNTINEINAKAINHSEIKLEKFYENLEKEIITQFDNTLQNNIKEEKSPFDLFEVLSREMKVTGNSKYLNFGSDSLSLIRRTKKLMMEKTFRTLMNYGIHGLQKDCLEYVQSKINDDGISYINLANKKYEYQYDLSGLEQSTSMEVSQKIDSEVKTITNYLIEQNINQYEPQIKRQNKSLLIQNYMDNNTIPYVKLIRDIIMFYYKELGIYNDKNNQVKYLLNKNKNENKDIFFLENKKISKEKL